MKVDELQKHLFNGDPIVVLDVRPRHERETWSIPGSIWVDAYQDLNHGQTDRLDALEMPTGVPVATVCAGGVTAAVATRHLRTKGIPAHTLEGGMNAWNQAYNLTETRSPDGTRIVQVRRTGRGCLSHVLENQGKALVVDAGLPPQVYEDVVQQIDARIVGVLDTHVHADHLSRTPAIARRHRVPYYIGRTDGVTADHRPLADGDEIDLGDNKVQVLHTPGHTWEHDTFRLDNVLLTGDTLFTDGVGRPDLGAGHTQTRDRAVALHDSLRRLMDHEPGTRVLPAHASRPLPFDRVEWSATLAQVRERVGLLSLGADDFVDEVLARIGDVPEHYHRIVALNRMGEWDEEEATELEAGPNRCASGSP